MLLLYIFFLVILFSVIPLVITMTKKASSCASMKRAIERAGGKFLITNPLWYTALASNKNCDFHILISGRVISVKIISFYFSNTVFNFVDDRHYEIAQFSKKETATDAERKLVLKKKQPYNFEYKLPDGWKKLPKKRIILIPDPYPASIMKSQANSKKKLSSGDNTGEGELYTITSLINLLKTKEG